MIFSYDDIDQPCTYILLKICVLPMSLPICSAFKHYKRSDFTNKNLAKSTVDLLDKQGVHWLWLTGRDNKACPLKQLFFQILFSKYLSFFSIET